MTEVQADVDDGQLTLRADGSVVGEAVAAKVVPVLVPMLRKALAAGAVGPAGSVTLAITECDLLVGTQAGRVTLAFRDPRGIVTREFQLSSEAAGQLLKTLNDSPYSPLRVNSWATRRLPYLSTLAGLRARRRELQRAGMGGPDLAAVERATATTVEQYRQALPDVPVARNPDTGAVVTMPLDNGGIDGPFWDSENPIRRLERTPPTYVVTSGAMLLDRERLEQTPFMVQPGPSLPCVHPELLERDGVRAVLATVPVGRHTGYAVTYFGPMPQPDPLVNEWGARTYWRRLDGQATRPGAAYDRMPEPSFDLRPWIERGSLLWIQPGDPELTLITRADGCPYLDLLGGQAFQHVRAGDVW